MGTLRDRRVAVWVAIVIGAVESVTLLLAAGRNNQSALLAVLFSGWVLAPFAALAWANIASVGWRPAMQTTVHVTTVMIAVVSLALYARWIPMPAGSPNAFVFVATPPTMLVILVFVLSTARVVRGVREKQP